MNGDGDSEWLSGWEQQCADAIDQQQPDYEQSLRDEADDSQTRLWAAFQDSAAAIAQLYRDRITGEPATLWLQFQTAAGTVTSLYRDSSDCIKKSSELAKQCGYQKRNKEIMNWAKRKRRVICREDLLTYLSGKPPKPNHHQYHHHSHHRIQVSSSRSRQHGASTTPTAPTASDVTVDDEQLHATFRDALARSRLARTNAMVGANGMGAQTPDLCAFIQGEMARHCGKRPASPSDVTMDSPTQQKRPRYM